MKKTNNQTNQNAMKDISISEMTKRAENKRHNKSHINGISEKQKVRLETLFISL
jgi:hypothetical protein